MEGLAFIIYLYILLKKIFKCILYYLPFQVIDYNIQKDNKSYHITNVIIEGEDRTKWFLHTYKIYNDITCFNIIKANNIAIAYNLLYYENNRFESIRELRVIDIKLKKVKIINGNGETIDDIIFGEFL
jgi:hypothetical protein